MSADAVRDWSLALMIAAVCGAVAIFVLWLLADLAVDAVKARLSRTSAAPAEEAPDA